MTPSSLVEVKHLCCCQGGVPMARPPVICPTLFASHFPRTATAMPTHITRKKVDWVLPHWRWVMINWAFVLANRFLPRPCAAPPKSSTGHLLSVPICYSPRQSGGELYPCARSSL